MCIKVIICAFGILFLVLCASCEVAQEPFNAENIENFNDTLEAMYRAQYGPSFSTAIPDSDLWTGVYYKLSMRSFPFGVVTWTELEQPTEKWNYVQVFQDGTTPALEYQPGAKYYDDCQFMFLPSSVSGYYQIVNKGLPHKKLVVSTQEPVQRGFYLALDEHSGERPVGNTLFKPVQVDKSYLARCEHEVCSHYYQLKSLSYPHGAITYSSNKYGDHSRYVVIDNDLNDIAYMDKYTPGGEWYRDTHFLFDVSKN